MVISWKLGFLIKTSRICNWLWISHGCVNVEEQAEIARKSQEAAKAAIAQYYKDFAERKDRIAEEYLASSHGRRSEESLLSATANYEKRSVASAKETASSKIDAGVAGVTARSQAPAGQRKREGVGVLGWIIIAGVMVWGIVYLPKRFSGRCFHCGKYRAMVEGEADYRCVKSGPVKDSKGNVKHIAHTYRLQIPRQCKDCGYQDVIIKNFNERSGY